MGPKERNIRDIIASIETGEARDIDRRAAEEAARIEDLERRNSTDSLLAESSLQFGIELSNGFYTERDHKIGLFTVLALLMKHEKTLDRIYNHRVSTTSHTPYDASPQDETDLLPWFLGGTKAHVFHVYEEEAEPVEAFRFRHSWMFLSSTPPGPERIRSADHSISDLDIYYRSEELTTGTVVEPRTDNELVFHIRTAGRDQLATFVELDDGEPLDEFEIIARSSKERALNLIQTARAELNQHLSTKKR